MKTLQKLFYVACIVFFFASCEETYNDKLFWPGEISQEYGSYIKPYTLDLTYSGEKLIGKTVSFKTENSETGTLTLNDVIPGEVETPIQISLCEKEDSYSFDGVATSLTGATIKYNGVITPKNLDLALDVKMADPDGLASDYGFGTYEMVDNSDAFQYILFKGACYFSIIPQEGVDINKAPMLYMMSVIGSSALQVAMPQLLKDIRLEENGNVSAKFSSDPIDVEQLLTLALNGTSESEIQRLVRSRTYQPVPTGIAHWNMVNDKFILKLNIPALINEVIKNSQQEIDSQLISGITEAIFKADPIRLKGLLGTLNAFVNNDILGYLVKTDDATFTALFSCIKNGIPMNVSHTEDGHTYLYLDYQTLTPIINVASGIKIDAMGMTIDLSVIGQEWQFMQTVNLGFDLVAKKNN